MKDNTETVKKKINTNKITVVIAAAVIAVIISMIVSLFLPSFGNTKEPVEVYITYGTGLRKITSVLEKNGLVRNGLVFQVFAFCTGANKHFKAGEYEFLPSDSALTVAIKLIKGDVKKYRVVVPEGSDMNDIDSIITSSGMLKAGEFKTIVTDPLFLKKNGIDRPTAEGFLFPDTYNLIRGETPEKIAQTMLERFKTRTLIDVDRKYIVQGYSITGFKVLIMASIIEKESKLDSERFLVSSVFYNRLKSPEAYQRRLESCATVRYALNKKHGIITYKDLKSESPYNTYIRIGMPPGPICNPGAASMAAALNPAVTKYKYFVLFENGGHTFSETLEQHDHAKAANKKIRQDEE
jgi:UPF0755 protein